jgi:hypothetical protein
MVRSIWRGALVGMLAWVGLAWSQPERTSNGPETSPATMTVRENGKDVPCRIVTRWQEPGGAKAFQLQIIATGEMLTLVEDGPATTFQGQAGKMKALSMTIYHWGNRSTSPPGVPAPPQRMSSEQVARKPIVLSENNVRLINLTPDPVLPPGTKMCSPPKEAPGGNLACNSYPGGYCPGNPCAGSGAGMVQYPTAGSSPYAQMPTGSKTVSASTVPAGSSPYAQSSTGSKTVSASTVPAGSSPYAQSSTGNKTVSASTIGAGGSPYSQMPTGSKAGSDSTMAEACQAGSSCETVPVEQYPTATRPTLGGKVKNLFHRQDQGPASCVCQNTCGQNTGSGYSPCTVPSSPLTSTQPLSIPDRTATGASTTTAQQCVTGSSAGTAAKTCQACNDNKPSEKKSRWERIWGKPLIAKTKQPGQSTVDPTPSGTGPAVAAATAMPAPSTGSTTKGAPLADAKPAVLPPPSSATASNLPAVPSKFPQAVAQGKAPMPPASNDPLLNPDQVRSSRVEAKVGSLTPSPLANVAANSAGPGLPGMPGGLQNPPLTMGSGSVLAAQNGLPIPYHYMPVPVVTVPNPLRLPGPPPPDVPAPPQPTAFVNAFSPGKVAPKPGEGQQNPMAANALGPFNPGPYGPIPDPRMMGYPPQPVAQGMPYPGMNPYLMPYMVPPQMANGPGMMPPMPAMTPLGMQRPIAQVNYPSNYQGPMPPSPMIGSNMLPMPYPQPMQPTMPMPQAGNLAMDRPGSAPAGQGAGSLTHMLGQLRDSISPAERELAALNLANQDCRSHPEIVQALVTAARQDPAATVRAGCVHSLAVQNVNTLPVLTALNALKIDPDPRVRQEADQALTRLTGGQTPVNTPPLQPTSYRP